MIVYMFNVCLVIWRLISSEFITVKHFEEEMTDVWRIVGKNLETG